MNTQQKRSFWQRLYVFLASMKLTVVIFFSLAASSVLGTLLPQGLTEHEVHSNFSPAVARIIHVLGLTDLYHAGWFRFLLLLLCINLIVCTLHRLPKTLSQLRQREGKITPERLVKFSHHSQFTTSLPATEIEDRLSSIISDEFSRFERFEGSNNFSAMAEKGRWSRWMVYTVHLSVLLIVVGALTGSIFGFKGFMNIAEGSSSNEVRLYRGGTIVTLPFEVRCDDFDVSYYDTGAPKEYRSELSIISDGQTVLERPIIVNDPLEYQGITFYQSSYGTILKSAKIELRDNASGRVIKLTLPYGESVAIPETTEKLRIVQYRENMARFGPALGIALFRKGEEPVGAWILAKMPQFHGNRVGNYQVKVVELDDSYYTGLQVKKDPGLWIVYFGFTALLIGIGMTFYSSHRKLWVWAGPHPKKNLTRIILAGRTNRNILAFERDFKRLCQRVAEEFKTQPEKRQHES